MVKSPRFLRPHTVEIINKLAEEDWEERTSSATIEFVKVMIKHSKTFGSTGSTTADKVLVTIDLNDYRADKEFITDEDLFTDPESQFVIRRGDRIRYQGKEYEITSVEPVNPLRNAPEFLEVIAS